MYHVQSIIDLTVTLNAPDLHQTCFRDDIWWHFQCVLSCELTDTCYGRQFTMRQYNTTICYCCCYISCPYCPCHSKYSWRGSIFVLFHFVQSRRDFRSMWMSFLTMWLQPNISHTIQQLSTSWIWWRHRILRVICATALTAVKRVAWKASKMFVYMVLLMTSTTVVNVDVPTVLKITQMKVTTQLSSWLCGWHRIRLPTWLHRQLPLWHIYGW